MTNKTIKQILIVKDNPKEFEQEVNKYLEMKNWTVVPNTHIAQWKNVSSSSGNRYGNDIKSKNGYFAIVLQLTIDSII